MVAQPLFRKNILTLSATSLSGCFTRDVFLWMSSSAWKKNKKSRMENSCGRSELSSACRPGHSSDIIHRTNTIVDEGNSMYTDHSEMILFGSIQTPLRRGDKQNSQLPSSSGGLASVSVGTKAYQFDSFSSSGSLGGKNSIRVSGCNAERNDCKLIQEEENICKYQMRKLPDSFSKSNLSNSNSEVSATTRKIDSSVPLPELKPFDICPYPPRNFGKTGVPSVTEKPLDEIVLRSGMVLLKHFISHKEQVEIVETIRKLGRGPGGFYQPFYRGGAKLRLQMMCLGRNWDPETKYTIKRSIDGCVPLCIPGKFTLVVQRAIQRAHFCVQKESKLRNDLCVIPAMIPDICIVNFYTTRGKLGLHQDRDESRESLRKGLPVVSFSIGDSAEFLFSDQRDMETAESILLESGDVLIFGGESRLVFHGVSSIIPKSAPKTLLGHTGLLPGRLNLTFRQF